ncbi:hypothetical protein MRB53_007630 [Persea americana]|uniref:Uncharacterized protein n=1 Tax=Persea americana TaxID=3435 RepID=A0ACC2MJH4_PERAE|nr:hypothetical protein MRB53_007630 [Persea americana]
MSPPLWTTDPLIHLREKLGLKEPHVLFALSRSLPPPVKPSFFQRISQGRKRITLGDVAVMMNLIQKRGRKRAA